MTGEKKQDIKRLRITNLIPVYLLENVLVKLSKWNFVGSETPGKLWFPAVLVVCLSDRSICRSGKMTMKCCLRAMEMEKSVSLLTFRECFWFRICSWAGTL